MVVPREGKKVKGAVVSSYLKVVQKKWGITTLDEVTKYIGLKSQLKDRDWVDIELRDKIFEWVMANKGEKALVQMAKTAVNDMGVFSQMFFSIMGIKRLLKRSGEYYRTMFSFGEVEVEFTEDGAILTLKDGKTSEYTCIAWHGALEGFYNVTHTKGTVKQLDCSDMDCKFVLDWK